MMTKDHKLALGFFVFAVLLLIAILVFGDNYQGIGWAASLLAISAVYLVGGNQLKDLYREIYYDETVDRDLRNDPLGIRVTWKIFLVVVAISVVLVTVWGLVFRFELPLG